MQTAISVEGFGSANQAKQCKITDRWIIVRLELCISQPEVARPIVEDALSHLAGINLASVVVTNDYASFTIERSKSSSANEAKATASRYVTDALLAIQRAARNAPSAPPVPPLGNESYGPRGDNYHNDAVKARRRSRR